MTVPYTPRWQPELLTNPVEDFDLCEITIPTRSGRRQYCHEQAVTFARDVDGSYRLLCMACAQRLFPGMDIPVRTH